MSTLYFFVGIGLGSLGGFLLALLVVHGRAQSLAEEMLAQRAAERTAEGSWGRTPPGAAPRKHWGYAPPHPSLQHSPLPTFGHGLGME